MWIQRITLPIVWPSGYFDNWIWRSFAVALTARLILLSMSTSNHLFLNVGFFTFPKRNNLIVSHKETDQHFMVKFLEIQFSCEFKMNTNLWLKCLFNSYFYFNKCYQLRQIFFYSLLHKTVWINCYFMKTCERQSSKYLVIFTNHIQS